MVGLTVVLARRKEMTPDTLTATPTRTKPAEIHKRPAKSKPNDGTALELSHIMQATNNTRTTGGTLNSSKFLVEFFWFNHCPSGRPRFSTITGES